MTTRKRITKIWTFAIAATVIMGIAAGSAWGVEYFVAPGGSDGNGGTGSGDAFATISNAVAQSDADIVTVANGTYDITEQIVVDKAVTIRSFGGGIYGGLANATNTVVDQGGSNKRVIKITDAGVVLDGLTITGGNGRGDWHDTDGSGVKMTGGVVQNCIIKDNGGDIRIEGPGVWMSGGTVSNCIVQGNSTTLMDGKGGGICATGGEVIDCQVLDNSAIGGVPGGGIYANGASVLIRNCLIARNLTDNLGGGIYLKNGIVESCTIVANSAVLGGGGVYRFSGTVSNSIVYNNTGNVGAATPGNDLNTTVGLSYTCASDGNTSDGNITGDPVFVDLAGEDYHLQASSPAIDAGANQVWMDSAKDLDGNDRILGGTVDMGAYEVDIASLPLSVSFVADVTDVQASSSVVFTATVAGGSGSVTSYAWDFGDGNTDFGATLDVVANTYNTPGVYTVSVTVNTDAPDSKSSTKNNYITVWNDTVYAATNSPSPAVPYDTWANAAHDLVALIRLVPSGVVDTVVVSNGTYNITEQITVDKPLSVISYGDGVYGGLANAANTVVQRSSGTTRIFQLTDGGAVLDGLTIRDGSGRGDSGWDGNGVYMTGGLVRNCIIKDNGYQIRLKGAGIRMTGGTVSNCIVQANSTDRYGAGGIYADGESEIVDCQVLDNHITLDDGHDGAGGIYAASASVLIRNCLIARNSTVYQGGGIYLGNGSIESSTIVSNSAAIGAGGLYRNSGTVSNSIVYFNTVSGSPDDLNTTDGLAYTCASDGNTTDGNITDDPLLEDLAGGNYRLTASSPCINAGDSSVVTWSTDLDGNPRIQTGAVDMGAYELFVIPAGTVIFIR